jgi:hypothetical protein
VRRAAAGLLVLTGVLLAGTAHAQWLMPDRSQPSISVQSSASSGERTYVVETGDTLWSIAEGLYDDPWYWPSLWSYNPQVTNPHLIYPGDVLYLSRRAAPPVATQGITIVGSRFETVKGPKIEVARRVGYISSRDYRESGVIEASREEHNMLGSLDEVYVRFAMRRCAEEQKPSAEQKASDEPFVGPCVKAGDRYVVYHVDREVIHPITGQVVGYKIDFLGEGRVIGDKKALASVLLTRTYTEVSRGDLVTNVFEPLQLVKPVPNKVQLTGVIVDMHHESNSAGTWSYIYVDRGAEDGVVRGNRFEVVWRGDGLKGGDAKSLKDYPDEQIGVATVVEAYDRHSLAILSSSVREIERGMPVIMAKGF